MKFRALSHLSVFKLQELAPCFRWLPGIIGPVPPPLWIRVSCYSVIEHISISENVCQTVLRFLFLKLSFAFELTLVLGLSFELGLSFVLALSVVLAFSLIGTISGVN